MKYIKQKCIILLILFIIGMNANAQVPVFNSFSSATATIFLDFDGHYVSGTIWNGGNPINCAATTMTTAEITEAFNRVAEDYRPFNVNVTTDEAVYLAAPVDMRIRVIVTPTNSWYTGVGGVSYIGSFIWGDDTPAFVFSNALGNSPKMVGECCSHESGHTLGLSHQSTYDVSDCDYPTEEYNSGTGGGLIGWAPIMGNSYYKNLTRWHNGQTPYGCTSTQDNLDVITTQNGFSYRNDDHGNNAYTTTAIPSPTSPLPVSINGIIEKNTDVDFFSFCNPSGAERHIIVKPRGYNGYESSVGANLDMKITIYSIFQNVIASYDAPNSPEIDIITPPLQLIGFTQHWTYLIKVESTGNANCNSYGSLGAYQIQIYPGSELDYNCSVEIMAPPQGDPFGRNWNSKKQTTDKKDIILPNPILLNNAVVANTAKINSPDKYSYMIFNINGQLIGKGQLTKGINNINVGAKVKGVYLIRYIGNNKQWTEKFVVQ